MNGEFAAEGDLIQLITDEEDDANAVAENRIWTWKVGGDIVSGVQTPGWDFLITKKAYTEEITVK
jgi:hypothetical protein